MSTGNMPESPDHLTTQATSRDTQGQDVAPPTETTGTTQALPLGADMARIIEEQVDVIAQQLLYHTQMLLGVSALGTDAVTARLTTLTVAKALRSQTAAELEYTLVNMGDPQIAQINDRTLPVKLNSQLAGLLEGILIDTVQHAYREDSPRRNQARLMLERLFQPANEQMQYQSKALTAPIAPGPGPNARE